MNGLCGATNLRRVPKSPSLGLGLINRLRNPRRNSRERKREEVLEVSETLRFKESERRGVTSKSRDREIVAVVVPAAAGGAVVPAVSACSFHLAWLGSAPPFGSTELD